MQFATWIDIDVSRGVVALNNMSESLVTYISMKGPEDEMPELGEKPAEPPPTTAEADVTPGGKMGAE